MENQIVIQAKSIYKSFYDPVTIPILKDINLYQYLNKKNHKL